MANAFRFEAIDENGFLHVAGMFWTYSPSNDLHHVSRYFPQDECEALALRYGGEVLPPLNGVRGRCGYMVRIPLCDVRIPEPAALAYAEDVARCPLYHDGTPRQDWHHLNPLVQETWRRNPVARCHYGKPSCRQLGPIERAPVAS